MLRFFFRSQARSSSVNNSSSPRKIGRSGRTFRPTFDRLEARETPANLTSLAFNIPQEVANLGVSMGLYSNKDGVYLDPTTHQFQSISSVSGSQLPLVPLAQAGSNNAPVTTIIDIPFPTGNLTSGELFIFIGQVQTGLQVAGGNVAAPKATPAPSTPTVIDNFAQFEFNYASSGPGAGLDIDISAVDSTGFPFTLVYPDSAGLPFPLNPLGITLSQTNVRDGYMEAFAPGGVYEQFPEFLQGAQFAQQQTASSLQVAAPQDILSAETAPVLNTAVATANANSALPAGASYSYLITAFSDNVIANSGGVLGETVVSNLITVPNLPAGNGVALSWNAYLDPNTAGYNVYRYSTSGGAAPTAETTFNLVAQIPDPSTTTFTDLGAIPQAQQITPLTANGYGFNPLSEYYTSELIAFFDRFEQPNSFVLHSNGALWVGSSVSYTPTASWNETGATYRVLQLTARNDVPGVNISEGDVVNIYQPIFSTNTRFVANDLPPMPSWLITAGGKSPNESPAQMVFGCDAVFASNAFDPDVAYSSDVATALGSIENMIVTAFNRGLANNPGIQPDNWAAFPQMLGQPTVAANPSSQVTATTTYYYAVTAVNVFGETTPSLEVTATLNTGQAATIAWANGADAAPALHYKIYRGESPDNLGLLFTTPDASHTSFTDLGGGTTGAAPAFEYFQAGTRSNWYAAYVQTNSLLDAQTGVSINGLSYGFPYSDQGGVSTNILFPPGEIPDRITVNIGSLAGPGFVTQSLPPALVNSNYLQKIVASGPGTGTTYTISSGTLPAGVTLDPDTGVLSGVMPASPTKLSFAVQASNSAGSVTMPFAIDVVSSLPPTPVTVSGLAAGILNLPAAAVNVPYTADVNVSGGVGPYFLAIDPSNTLPTGIQLGTLGTSVMQSATGTFTLSGTQTTVYDSPNVGFKAVVSDSTVAQATASLGITDETINSVAVAGSGYAVGDLLNVTGGGGTGAVLKVAVVDGTGGITSVTVDQPGTGFTNVPTGVSTQTGSGSGATLGFVGNKFQAIVTILNAGSDYAAVPTVTFYGGGIVSAAGSATVSAGAVSAVTPPANTFFTAAAGNPVIAISPPKPSASMTFTLQLQVNPTLAVVTTKLPTAYLNTPYTQTIDTNNNGSGVSFAVTAGALPAGMTLTPWGVLSGSPTASGSFSFSITATDPLGETATQPFTLDVSATPPTPLAFQTTSLPSTATTVAYNSTIVASGGTGGHVFAVVNGSLPPGLSMSDSGQITGTATQDGTFPFTVRATDSLGVAAYQGFTIGVLGVETAMQNLAANAGTLIITGSGFDTTPANNTVTLTGAGNVTVTAATTTSLTVTFTGPLTVGALDATVTVAGQTTPATQVATVVAASTPTVTQSTDNLASSSKTLVITGTGFDTSANGTNIVTLSSGSVKSVVVNSATQLTVTFQDEPALGALDAVVTVDGVASASTQVATIATPIVPSIYANTNNLFTSATEFVINGVNFVTGGGTSVALTWADGTALTGYTTAVNSADTITIGSLAFTSNGVLNAVVTVNGVASDKTQVATVLPAGSPIIVPATGQNLAPNATTLAINGWGFTSDTVTLTANFSSKAPEAITGFTATLINANLIIVTGLAIPAGASSIDAAVTGIAAPGPQVALVQSATGSAATITSATTNIAPAQTTLTIAGTGFDPNGTNIVQLYSGAGKTPIPATVVAPLINGSGQNVVSNGAGTQLTVALAGPLPMGELWAEVTTDGVPMTQAVQIATVVGLTVDSGTVGRAPNATLLMLDGVGFDPNGVNEVSLFTGASGTTPIPASAIESVYAESTTRLVVVLDRSQPLPVGALWASAEVDGISSGAAVQVATIAADAPGVSFSTQSLAVNATSLIINGSNFGTTAGSNTVVLSSVSGPIAGAVASVTAVSSTQLAVTLNPNVVSAGALYAVVTTSADDSDVVQVANVVPASTPTITTSSNNLQSSATTVVINGTGFDPSPAATNIVTLSSGTVQSVVVESATKLIVTVSGGLSIGSLKASVQVNGVSSALTQVAIVVAGSTPSIVPSPAVVSDLATTLVIQGTGFDTNAGATHHVTLSSGKVLNVVVNSATQLTLSLDPSLFPLAPGTLTAIVAVNGVPSPATQVATVQATPTIQSSTATFVAGTTTLVITGTGFDPVDADNRVVFSSGAGEVTAATSTSITVRMTAPPAAGALFAQVIVDGLASASTQVASVVPQATANSAKLPATATTLIITGFGFDPTPGNNQVAFSSGSGTVVSSTPTRLVVTLHSPPKLGALDAVVVVNGVASQGPTAVATIVPGPASTATSTVTVKAAAIAANRPLTVILTTFDALGNRITTGGLKVKFALVRGSAAGRFGPVKDLGDGRYAVNFIGVNMGTARFVAFIGGAQVRSTASATVFFQSFFAGVGNIGSQWATRFGGFTVANAIAKSRAPISLAVYKGAATRNVRAAVTVSSIGEGEFAGVVTRFNGNAAYYQAGVARIDGRYFGIVQIVTPTATGSTIRVIARRQIAPVGTARIRVEAVGSTLSLFINNTLVTTVANAKYAGGGVGIVGSNGTRFSDFEAAPL